VVPAAGAGKRMQAQIPKQYLQLRGRTVLEYTLDRLLSHPRIAGVAVAISRGDGYWPEVAARFDASRLVVADGGAERCHSVLNALDALAKRVAPEEWVLVHDAARPCLRHGDIDRLFEELESHPVGGILALPVSDTVKRTDARQTITRTVDRNNLWRALTPQMFRLGTLRDAIGAALARDELVTDESAAIEAAGLSPRVVEGQGDNIKITRPGDLALAELYLDLQALELVDRH
jgi:2-C-methyl-D-erythritol 4-phosphate cytidylyltransferase